MPLDILPSDVGGDKNAPLMVSLPPDSFLLNVGVSLPECELGQDISGGQLNGG